MMVFNCLNERCTFGLHSWVARTPFVSDVERLAASNDAKWGYGNGYLIERF